MTHYEMKIRSLLPTPADLAEMLAAELDELERSNRTGAGAKDHAIKEATLRRLLDEATTPMLPMFETLTTPRKELVA
jgi:hypothetical protein